MTKELHVYLYNTNDDKVLTTWNETKAALDSNVEFIFTTQLIALSFNNAERLFVHTRLKEYYEITIGKCIGTNREIKPSHNIVKLLLNGEFDWYKGKEVC